MFERVYNQIIKERLNEPRKFIQIVTGPRQVGKTTAVIQALKSQKTPYLFFSADEVPVSQREWIAGCWENARMRLRSEKLDSFILVIEIVLYEWRR